MANKKIMITLPGFNMPRNYLMWTVNYKYKKE